MKEQEIDEIIACLDKGRTLFYYFRDRYALLMMKYHVGRGKSVREIRRSGYGRLLSKPILKELIRQAGGGILTEELLNSVWVPRPECYLLTLGKWGGVVVNVVRGTAATIRLRGRGQTLCCS